MNNCPLCGNHNSANEKKKTLQGDIYRIVCIYRDVSGYKDDANWMNVYFRRYMRSAKDLLLFMGDWRLAGYCVEDIYQKFTELGFTVNLDTVMKHAPEWKKDHQEKGIKNGTVPDAIVRHVPLNSDGKV